MFQTASGNIIPFPEKIKEEFQVFETSILFNMSFEKFKLFINEFVEQLSEPLFFVLEIPLSEHEEIELRKDDTSPFHKKICYLDKQSKRQIGEIFKLYGELLLNDGISKFAIYSHVTNDGVYIQKYKIASIFSHAPTDYIEFLEKHGLTQTEKLLTAWDTFSYEFPGQANAVEIDGMIVYDVYDELVKKGMYVANVVED
ncbi:MAG: hypothetical protein FWB96_12490 [Defluviitaleaceae bacterium]|nr:hypothetical protein [Defluviitaleaceae bacterium]MCL2264066.1 hypothetical protein [Defluviitaleaceae bacterium]